MLLNRPEPTVWGTKLPFNTVCGEYQSMSGGWVHAVAFSPSGNALAFASHDASITVAYPAGPEQPPQAVYNIRLPSLPFLSLIFTNEHTIVAAGHDYEPIIFIGNDQSGWMTSKSLDDPAGRTGNAGRGISRGGLSGNEAFNRFKAADSRGISSTPAIGAGPGVAVGASNATKAGGERNTAHQNTITSIRAYQGQYTAEVSKISTSGLDGRIVIWNTAGLSSDMANLAVR